MLKVNSHSKEKMWENNNDSELRVFLNFSLEAEIHTVPKTSENWISVVREKYRKHNYFKFMGFLNISGEAEIHTIPQI